jgi:flavin prenyltransferase
MTKTTYDKPVIVAWTGASGLVYGVRLVQVLMSAGRDIILLTSSAVAQTAPVEMKKPVADLIAELQIEAAAYKVNLIVPGPTDFGSAAASGSATHAGMVVCPCSTGTLGRIAAGTSETLLLRAADVCLKERRKLILVPRETPLATHHLRRDPAGHAGLL